MKGFTLIEVLIGMFILVVLAIALTGLAILGTRTSFESERQNVAQAVLNEKIENIRKLAYQDVGYADATTSEPDGALQRTEVTTANQQEFTVITTVDLIDDPVNGTLPEDTINEVNADYKQVKAEVFWNTSGRNQRSASATTLIAPAAALAQCIAGSANACQGTISAGTGACIPNIACPANGLCPNSYTASPSCPEGAQFCPGCYTNNDCSAGETCNLTTKTCQVVPGACRSSADCSSGQVCQSGSCAASCVSAGCTGSDVCNQQTGICSPSCSGNSCTCPSGFPYCNTESGVCETPPPPPPHPTLCNGLIGYWKLDQGIGSIAADSAGPNNGSLINNPSWTASSAPTSFPNTSAIQFQGSNDQVNIPGSFPNPRQATEPFTVSTWARIGGNSLFKGIVEYLPTSTYGGWGFGFYTNGPSTFYMDAWNQSGSDEIAGNNPTPQQWHQYVGKFQGGVMSYYIDGVLVGTRTYSPEAYYYYNPPSGASLALGTWSMDGIVDDVRIYNRVLNEEEISDLANGDGYCPG